MINWTRHGPALQDAIATAPHRATPRELTAHVSEYLGFDVGYDAIVGACRRHLGLSLREAMGGATPMGTVAVNRQASPMVEPLPEKPLPEPHGSKLVFATGDWHVPYHDPEAVDVFFSAVEHCKPDVIVLLGDILDCYAVSQFDKDPSRMPFEEEIDIANSVLDRVSASDAPEVYYIEGNHEFRLRRYIAKRAPALWTFHNMRQLLRIDERGWGWRDYRGEAVKVGKMDIKHDIGKAGKYSGMQALADYGGNLTYGHTHRGGTYYGGNGKGEEHVVLNTGWLGDVEKVDYKHVDMARREYRSGFGVIRVDDATGNAFASFKPIVQGMCEIDGAFIGASGVVHA